MGSTPIPCEKIQNIYYTQLTNCRADSYQQANG